MPPMALIDNVPNTDRREIEALCTKYWSDTIDHSSALPRRPAHKTAQMT